MKKRVFFAAIALFLLAGQGYSKEPSMRSWLPRQGAKYINQDHYVAGNNRIRFHTFSYSLIDWRNEFEIGKKARDMIEHLHYCHVVGFKRWVMVPETINTVFILTWLNLENREYGWTAIKNTKEHWYVSSDQRSWTTQANYTRDENMYFRWLTNGTWITIHLRNPNNENGWTSEDIWYSFSYR